MAVTWLWGIGGQGEEVSEDLRGLGTCKGAFVVPPMYSGGRNTLPIWRSIVWLLSDWLSPGRDYFFPLRTRGVGV